MFKKLFRNIYLPIVIIAVTLIIFIDVFAIIMLTQTLNAAYDNVDKKRISRALDSCELYVSSVTASIYNLSLNGTLQDELKNHTEKSLTDILNNTCNYSLKINGVCAYSTDGTIYTSSGISQVPDLNELKKNDGIQAFIDGNQDDFISLRTECIADIYSNVLYPDEMGVITCCRKVYDEGQIVGWLFADILPSNLYDLLFERAQFDNAVAFITFGDSFFEYGGNAAQTRLLSGKHGGYFKYNVTADNGLFALTVFNSTREYSSRLTILIVILVAVSAALIIGVHFAAAFTAKSVTKRLDRLSEKMNPQKIS